MVTNGVDRPTPLPQRVRDLRRGRAAPPPTARTGGPGLRRRRGLRARPRRRGVHHPHRASRTATGWCTCRSPTPSTTNDGELYGAEVGPARRRAARRRASRARSIANGDGTDPSTPEDRVSPWRRAAVAALMTSDGQGAGRARRPRAPAARRRRAVRRAARPRPRRARRSTTRGQPGSVVLVEGSDLVRADLAVALRVGRAGGEDPRPRAARRPTASSGRLLEHVDHGRRGLVVGPTPPAARDALSVAAVRAPGFAPGLLRSTTTQRDGFVNITDVAPTVLTYFGLERPDAMEGRRMETGDAGGVARRPQRVPRRTSTRTACSATASSGRRWA